jgi:hypothetical protein
MLALAEHKGTLKLVLRGTDKKGATTAAANDNDTGEIDWMDDPFDKSSREPKDPVVSAPSTKLETAVVARKPVPQNTLINSDNVNDYFATMRLENVPPGVIQNPDDLKGKWIIKALDEGQYLYKSLTGNDRVDVAKKEDPAVTPAPTPKAPDLPVGPSSIVLHNRKLPRFTTTIQEVGRTKIVYWMEVQPGKWKRFDSEAEADNYKPEPESKPGSKGE